jgi:hypothetical protein
MAGKMGTTPGPARTIRTTAHRRERRGVTHEALSDAGVRLMPGGLHHSTKSTNRFVEIVESASSSASVRRHLAPAHLPEAVGNPDATLDSTISTHSFDAFVDNAEWPPRLICDHTTTSSTLAPRGGSGRGPPFMNSCYDVVNKVLEMSHTTRAW